MHRSPRHLAGFSSQLTWLQKPLLNLRPRIPRMPARRPAVYGGEDNEREGLHKAYEAHRGSLKSVISARSRILAVVYDATLAAVPNGWLPDPRFASREAGTAPHRARPAIDSCARASGGHVGRRAAVVHVQGAEDDRDVSLDVFAGRCRARPRSPCWAAKVLDPNDSVSLAS